MFAIALPLLSITFTSKQSRVNKRVGTPVPQNYKTTTKTTKKSDQKTILNYFVEPLKWFFFGKTIIFMKKNVEFSYHQLFRNLNFLITFHIFLPVICVRILSKKLKCWQDVCFKKEGSSIRWWFPKATSPNLMRIIANNCGQTRDYQSWLFLSEKWLL